MSQAPQTEAELDELLSRPTDADRAAMANLAGDVLVLGAGGKMGPSLTRLAQRASRDAGVQRRVIPVSRFLTPGTAEALATEGFEPLTCDLLDPDALAALPEVPNVILMAGQKFGTSADPEVTWALNALLPGMVARRFPTANLVCFSTGNVYPLSEIGTSGSTETDAVAPVGEYAQSALARERIVAFLAKTQGTPTTILRLNYAVELRYGVLRDIADRVWRRAPVDLTMGYVNVLWQRDACSVALRSLHQCSVPPLVLNVTGPETLSVRAMALSLGEHFSIEPLFTGHEAPTALLSDATRCWGLFGAPTADAETVLGWVADWVQHGGLSFQKPTHFQEREGRF